MNTDRKPTLARVALAAWWTAMAVGTHWPNLSAQLKSLGIDEGATPFMMLDKWMHISAYLGLIWLALTARLTPRRSATFAIIVIYSLLDEWTQGLVAGRNASGMDLLASNFGVILGTLTWFITRWLNDHDESFVAHGRVVAVLTLISRCFGLVRDWALAFAFGLSPVMDAFAIAFLIPNLFRRLFGEGALTAAFLPQYTRLRETSENNATHFARQTLLRLGLGLGALALLGSLIAWGLAQAGVLDERGILTSSLTAMLIWFAPMICATAIAGAVLQARGRFGPPAAAPVIMNIAIIGAAIITWRTMPDDLTGQRRVFWVALAVVGSGVVQLFWHLNLLPTATAEPDRPAIAEAGRRTCASGCPPSSAWRCFN